MKLLTVIVRCFESLVVWLGLPGCLAVSFHPVDTPAVKVYRFPTSKVLVSSTNELTVRFGIVYETDLDTREGILWASDGRLITIEGGFLIPDRR